MDIIKFLINLVPCPRIHFMLSSYTPVISVEQTVASVLLSLLPLLNVVEAAVVKAIGERCAADKTNAKRCAIVELVAADVMLSLESTP